MALYKKPDGSTIELQDMGGENAGILYDPQNPTDLTDYTNLAKGWQKVDAPAGNGQLYDASQYQFRADGTVMGPNGTEQMVIVPDPDGKLNALNGLGGQGYAIVPKSVADSNGLQITGVRGADPNYDEGGLSGILMKYGPAIIAAGAGAGALGAFGGGAGELVGGASGALGGATSSGFAGGGAGLGAAEARAAGAGLGLVGGASSQAVPTGLDAGLVGGGSGAEGAVSSGLAGTGAGIGQSAAETAAGAGAGTAGTTATAGSALSRIIDGSATTADYLSVLGSGAATGLGLYASNQQSNALQDLANKYLDFGAPSRARYEASMTPGFDPTTIPGYSGALDTASQSILRKLSATGGNPYGNPGGLIEANKAIVSGTALPAVQEYQRLNAGTGGIANLTAAAPAASSSAIGSNTNFYNALGAGISTLTNPQSSLADLYKKYSGLSLA